MLTQLFKIQGKDINISWSDSDNFKELLGPQTNWFGNHLNFTNEIISAGLVREYEAPLNFLLDHIALPENPSIVDIGSGTSITDLVLYQFLDKKAKFYLIDGSTVEELNKGLLHTREFAPYNAWSSVIDAIETNNFNQEDFIFWLPNTSTSNQAHTQYENVQVDMVFSKASCGLHYPIEVYWDRVLQILKPGGWFCVMPVLNVGNQYELICSHFGEPKAKIITTLKTINDIRPNEASYWETIIPNANDENAIWGYKAIWQRPL